MPGGRPRKPERDKLCERLDLRAAADEKSDFEKCADLAGMKLSDWIRDRLKLCAKRELRHVRK